MVTICASILSLIEYLMSKLVLEKKNKTQQILAQFT